VHAHDRNTDFLDLFRGLAAFWVAAAHCMIWGKGPLPDFLDPKRAVDLFMVISGFLMVYTLDRIGDNPSLWSTWRAFYIRRFLRIAPLYYTALAAVMLLWPLVSHGLTNLQSLDPAKWAGNRVYGPQFQDFGPFSIFLHLTFLFGLSPRYSFSTSLPDWSLSLEMQFYAVFPLLYLATRRRSMMLMVAVALGFGCFAFTHYYDAAADARIVPMFNEPSLLLFNLPKFLVGMLLYNAGRRRSWPSAATAIVMFVIALRHYGITMWLAASLVSALGACWYFRQPQWAMRITGSKPVRFFSETSYAVYLFHGIMLATIGGLILPKGPGFLLLLPAAVLGSAYLLGWVANRTVERWGVDLGKRITGRRPAKPMV
jgi:peptidoglycan/LPS O-acetylase OafA/YrhL